MQLYRFSRYVLLAVFSMLATACVLPKTSLDSLSELKPNEVVYVGKVQLSPHLNKDEVVYENVLVLGGSKDELHKAMFMKVSDKYYTLEGRHAMEMGDSVATTDGGYFYFAWDKDRPLHILGTSFFTHMSSTRRDTMTLKINNGLKVSHKGKSKAVYIGDIIFKRDEFFNIKDIIISQKNYKMARKEFRKKYNTKWNLAKAKLTSSR